MAKIKRDKDQKIKIGKAFALHTLKFPYRRFLDSLGERLKWVHPDVISFIALFVSFIIGFLYYYSLNIPFLLIINIFLIILRMTLNTLDGLIALKIGRSSMLGKVVNALPDRYADLFILIGITLSPLCNLKIGMFASLTVLLVSYSGMLGKAVGVSWQQQGPLDKVDRLFLLIGASLVQFILIKLNHAWFIFLGMNTTVMELCMLLFILLGQITIINRVIGMVREIKKVESK